MKKVGMLVVLVSLALASAASAASDEMRKLDFMIGEWKGEGSMQRGPAKPELSLVHEKIRSMAGGSVLAIEGRGNQKLEGGKAGDVVHDAFGVIWWDAAAKKYRFSAFTAEAGQVDASFELTAEKTARWGFTTPQGQVRYTIHMTEHAEWHEVGEFSRDGAQWMKFFEMTLAKVR